MNKLSSFTLCIALIGLACNPEKKDVTGWQPMQEDTLHKLTPLSNAKEEFPTLLQSYGFDEADGRFLHYRMQSDSTALLVWGDGSFQRVAPDTLWSNKRNYWPSLDTITSNYIVLNYGCGSPCWGKMVLPFDQNKRIENYMYDYFFDVTTNLVGYYDYKNDKNRFVVVNVNTGKEQHISLQPACESGFGGDCLDSVQFNNRQLTIVWNIPYAFADSIKIRKTIRKRISI